MDISEDLERRILAMPGVTVNGLPPTAAAARRPPRPATVDAAVGVAFGTTLWITAPIITASELNSAGRRWRDRHRRGTAAWAVLRAAVGPNLAALAPFAEAYAGGSALNVRFVRLGGRRMDRSNLPGAFKATEDALAYLLGCDDGDPRWRAEWAQEPGGAAGVRIEISVEGERG